MTSLPEVLSTHWLVIILHSWVWTWNPYIILNYCRSARCVCFRIRVALTGGHHKLFYRRTRCRRYNKTDSGFNNWIDEWLSLWIGFIYSHGSTDRHLKILLGPRPVRSADLKIFLVRGPLLFFWLIRSGPLLSKFRWSVDPCLQFYFEVLVNFLFINQWNLKLKSWNEEKIFSTKNGIFNFCLSYHQKFWFQKLPIFFPKNSKFSHDIPSKDLKRIIG